MSVCYDNSYTEVDSIKYKQVIICSHEFETPRDPQQIDEVSSSIGSCDYGSTMARMDNIKRVSFTGTVSNTESNAHEYEIAKRPQK